MIHVNMVFKKVILILIFLKPVKARSSQCGWHNETRRQRILEVEDKGGRGSCLMPLKLWELWVQVIVEGHNTIKKLSI